MSVKKNLFEFKEFPSNPRVSFNDWCDKYYKKHKTKDATFRQLMQLYTLDATTEKEREAREFFLCCGLMAMDCRGLQGF